MLCLSLEGCEKSVVLKEACYVCCADLGQLLVGYKGKCCSLASREEGRPHVLGSVV